MQARVSTSTTWYASIAATVAWFALLLQFYLTLRQSNDNGFGALHGMWLFIAFFTILTNLIVAVTLTLPLLHPRSSSGQFFTRPSVITGVAANIALVGIAYNLLLRNIWNPQGLQLLADILLHDVLPIAFVLYWWQTAARAAVRYADIVYWAIYPIIYFIYALLRGAATGFYAYPFIDVARLGLAQVIANALGILLGFVIIAALLIAFGNIRSRNSGPRTAPGDNAQG